MTKCVNKSVPMDSF